MGSLVVLLAYLVGSVPFGYLVIRAVKGADLTKVGSGRTGGTNAMRAGGFWLGLLTAALDIAKGFLTVWIARWLVPDTIWVHVLAGVAVVLGHNWSIWLFLTHRRFSGGAGAGPNVGVAIAFWPAIALIIIPVGAVLVLIVGYASLATLATAFLIPLSLYLHHLRVDSPWQFAIYGLLTAILVTLSLRPNIQRLLQGNERRVGLFARSSGGSPPG